MDAREDPEITKLRRERDRLEAELRRKQYALNALKAATDPTLPRTHHSECWRDHHACAVRRIEAVLAYDGDSPSYDAYAIGHIIAYGEAPKEDHDE
jgi:hypothetical protein